MKTYKLPLGSNQSKGRAVVNVLPLQQDEVISTILPLLGEKEEWIKKNIVFATNTGDIRISGRNTQGVTLMKASEEEKVVSVAKIEAEEVVENTEEEKL